MERGNLRSPSTRVNPDLVLIFEISSKMRDREEDGLSQKPFNAQPQAPAQLHRRAGASGLPLNNPDQHVAAHRANQWQANIACARMESTARTNLSCRSRLAT